MEVCKLKAPSFKHPPSTKILIVAIFAEEIICDFNGLSVLLAFSPKWMLLLLTEK